MEDGDVRGGGWECWKGRPGMLEKEPEPMDGWGDLGVRRRGQGCLRERLGMFEGRAKDVSWRPGMFKGEGQGRGRPEIQDQKEGNQRPG